MHFIDCGNFWYNWILRQQIQNKVKLYGHKNLINIFEIKEVHEILVVFKLWLIIHRKSLTYFDQKKKKFDQKNFNKK